MLSKKQLKKVMVKSDDIYQKICNQEKNCDDCILKHDWCNIRWISERILCEQFFAKYSKDENVRKNHKRELERLNNEMEQLLRYTGLI